MQLEIAVVYPQEGNLGGGGFITFRMADGTLLTLDFRKMASALAFKDMFMQVNENRDSLMRRKIAHLSSGVPSTIAGIFESLRYAKLTIEELFQPAIDLAEEGYSYQVQTIKTSQELNTMPNAFIGREEKKSGDLFKQLDLAATLKRI